MDVESGQGLPGGSAAVMDYEQDQQQTSSLGALQDASVAASAAPGADGLLPPPSKLPSPAQQAREIEAAEAKELTEGETVYLISEGWWGKWCSHTKYKQQAAAAAAADHGDSSAAEQSTAAAAEGGGEEEEEESPGSIDNYDIVAAESSSKTDLRSNLEEDKDFVIVTSDSWSLLHGWYGGGPIITRTAVMEGLAPHTKRPRVMLYPWRLQVCWGAQPNQVQTVEAERQGTVRCLKERACAAFGVDPSKVEIWDYFNHGKYANLEPCLDQDLEAARILEDQAILLDDKDNPLPENNTTSSSPIMMTYGSAGAGRGLGRMSSLQEDQAIQRGDGRPGLVGLQNLGNTCFMNSSLQCLMHTVPILRVFLSGDYEADVNTTNPLGLKGQLARALGSLIALVWKPGVGSVSPRAFKSKVAQFAPQFSGYQQHDSQEFLAFLLDGLHEDINRIQHKPYIEEPDSEGVPDAQLAATAWTNYRLRNDSSIVDHFQGLYKSTLVCPQCAYSSVKFDPFMYLSLPLPESRVRALTAILLHADGAAAPREYGVEVPQSGTLKDLYAALVRVARLPPLTHPGQQMVAAKLRQGSHTFGCGLSTFEDPGTRVSELGRDLSSSEVLLVYYYADPSHGPGGVRGGAGGGGVEGGAAAAGAAGGAEGEMQQQQQQPDHQQQQQQQQPDHQQQQEQQQPDQQQQAVQVKNQKVQVFHRHAGMRGGDAKFSAPLLLWLPPSETYDPAVHVRKLGGSSSSGPKQVFGTGGGRLLGGSGEVEYALTEDAPLWRHVQQMMQPFRAPHTLWQQPAAAAGEAEPGEQQQQGPATGSAAMSADQQQTVSTGAADVSMAAAEASGVAVLADSPDPLCCTSQPSAAAAAAAAAGQQQCGAGGAWGSDGGGPDGVQSTNNNKAGSEAGDAGGEGGAAGEAAGNNSTWGSQGSDPLTPAAHSDADMADLTCDEEDQQQQQQQGTTGDGISRAASQQNLAAAGGGDAMESEGGGAGAPHSSPTAAAAGSNAPGVGGMLGSGGVPVAPLDLWSAQAAQQQQQQRDQDQQQAAAAAAAAAGSSDGSTGGMSPYYQLKLAHDNGSNTVVQSWNASQFHPKHTHSVFMMDWHRAAGLKVSHGQYLAAAAAAEAQYNPAALQQALGGAAGLTDDQQQQQGMEDQQQPSAAAGGGSTAGLKYWLPDTTGLQQQDDTTTTAAAAAAAPALSDDTLHEVVGQYVLDGMQQPQHDASVGPIHAARSDPRGKVVSLEECVEAFLQPEQLSEADEWYCPKCKAHVQADKKLDLWALPEVLVVHLKRFSYTRWSRDKLDTQVRFPLEGLDLSRYVSSIHSHSSSSSQAAAAGAGGGADSAAAAAAAAAINSSAPVYDCYAVSNHYGGLGGGHYTAFGQMPDDKQWYLFDDSRVEDVRPEGVSRAAYLLFYRRRAAAAQDPPDLVPQLLEARERHRAAAEAAAAEAKAAQEAAAAAAAAAGGGPSAMDADDGGPDVGQAAGAAADDHDAGVPALAAEDEETEMAIIPPPAGSPDVGGGGWGGALLGIASPAPAAPAAAVGVGAAAAARVEDSSDTSTSRVNTAGALEEGDSSDGSSSRPRGGGGQLRGLQQRQAQAADVQAAAEAVDSWGPLAQHAAAAAAAGATPTPQRQARPSDQDMEVADIGDRDV